MSIFLDTNALIWFVDKEDQLGRSARWMIDQALMIGEVFVSAISFWEVGTLVAKRRIVMEDSVNYWRQAVIELGIEEVPVTGDIGILSTELTGLPRDPADRIVAASAIVIGAKLVTADGEMLRWANELERHDARK